MVIRHRCSSQRGSVFSSLLVFGAGGIVAMALVFSSTHPNAGHSTSAPLVQQHTQLGVTTDTPTPTDSPSPAPDPEESHGKHKGEGHGKHEGEGRGAPSQGSGEGDAD